MAKDRKDILVGVFAKVLRERAHGDIAFGTIEVSPKTFGDYLLLIEQMLARAKAKFVRCGSGPAGLENGTDIVKIASLAIRYMEECEQSGVNVSRYSELDIKVERDIIARATGMITEANYAKAIEAAADRIREVADRALQAISDVEKRLLERDQQQVSGPSLAGNVTVALLQDQSAGEQSSQEFFKVVRHESAEAESRVYSDPEEGLARGCTEETTGCTDASPDAPGVPERSIFDDL